MLPRVPLLAAVLMAGGLLGGPGPSLANPDDGTMMPTCPRGQVFDQRTLRCIAQSSGVVDDESLVGYAAALSRERRYDEVLTVLDLLLEPETAEALNYRGYATRKLGRIQEGIGHYLHAVALDPDYTLVREYLGEAFAIQGKLDLARQQLAEIEKRCGTACEPYRDLAEAIAAADI